MIGYIALLFCYTATVYVISSLLANVTWVTTTQGIVPCHVRGFPNAGSWLMGCLHTLKCWHVTAFGLVSFCVDIQSPECLLSSTWWDTKQLSFSFAAIYVTFS